MRRDSRLSATLHALLHLAEHKEPMTSEALAACMRTNSVVVRRTMAALRKAGLVRSEKGHGGGWTLTCDLRSVSLRDVYVALGEPLLFALGNRTENPHCLVEQAVNRALNSAFLEAEDLLSDRLSTVSLAELAADFHRLFVRHNRNQKKVAHGL